MRTARLLLVACLAIGATGAGTAFAELHYGFGVAEAWDFSEAASTDILGPWDFTTVNTVASAKHTKALDTFIRSNFPALIAVMPDGVSYESVFEAPADPSVYSVNIEFIPNRVWIVRTREAHYAKLRFVDPFFPGQFEYTYQDDGTRAFTQPTPVESTTWGRIKALYR